MTADARDIIESFGSLGDADGSLALGGLSADELTVTADELFLGYDQRETTVAASRSE